MFSGKNMPERQRLSAAIAAEVRGRMDALRNGTVNDRTLSAQQLGFIFGTMMAGGKRAIDAQAENSQWVANVMVDIFHGSLELFFRVPGGLARIPRNQIKKYLADLVRQRAQANVAQYLKPWIRFTGNAEHGIPQGESTTHFLAVRDSITTNFLVIEIQPAQLAAQLQRLDEPGRIALVSQLLTSDPAAGRRLVMEASRQAGQSDIIAKTVAQAYESGALKPRDLRTIFSDRGPLNTEFMKFIDSGRYSK